MSGTFLGVDIGGSLTKCYLYQPNGKSEYNFFPTTFENVQEYFLKFKDIPDYAVTGGGLTRFSKFFENLHKTPIPVLEFPSTILGASQLIENKIDRFISLTLGTGTTVFLSDNKKSVIPLGISVLGASSLMGLGKIILGVNSFQEIIELAKKGDSKKYDFLALRCCKTRCFTISYFEIYMFQNLVKQF
jgi:type II pantothenate kinase